MPNNNGTLPNSEIAEIDRKRVPKMHFGETSAGLPRIYSPQAIAHARWTIGPPVGVILSSAEHTMIPKDISVNLA
jgi:hypothetical protein